jgi:non-heme chloroperoxidase
MLHFRRPAGAVLLSLLVLPLCTQCSFHWKDPSPHVTRFVTVEPEVRLEVLDWGGSGRPIVLLAGGGDTAHVFDDFAPKLTADFHVVAITRRGFGESGYKNDPNLADRLGNDVLAVIDALKLNRPVLVGHSFGGLELSSVASRFPDRVAGLVYLEAGYSYAFNNGRGSSTMDMMQLKAPQPPEPGAADLASFRALRAYNDRTKGFSVPESELRALRKSRPFGRVGNYRDPPGGPMLMAALTTETKYVRVPVPAYFIFANPHGLGPWVDQSTDPTVQAEARTYSSALTALTEKQAKAVQEGLPAAQVITIAGANHYVYISNEAEVLRDMRAFISGLH